MENSQDQNKGSLACSFRKLSLQTIPVIYLFLFLFWGSHIW